MISQSVSSKAASSSISLPSPFSVCTLKVPILMMFFCSLWACLFFIFGFCSHASVLFFEFVLSVSFGWSMLFCVLVVCEALGHRSRRLFWSLPLFSLVCTFFLLRGIT
uniref:Uncharacterized protein n=1 Tax=Cacopsylla melanoneura TaxID=428564 RepID=A0A8D8YA92_9HEMI